MINGRHSAERNASPHLEFETRAARVDGRADADSDVTSVLRAWLADSNASLDDAQTHYRRSPSGES